MGYKNITILQKLWIDSIFITLLKWWYRYFQRIIYLLIFSSRWSPFSLKWHDNLWSKWLKGVFSNFQATLLLMKSSTILGISDAQESCSSRKTHHNVATSTILTLSCRLRPSSLCYGENNVDHKKVHLSQINNITLCG